MSEQSPTSGPPKEVVDEFTATLDSYIEKLKAALARRLGKAK